VRVLVCMCACRQRYACYDLCVCVRVCVVKQHAHFDPGLFSSFLWEQGFNKVHYNSRSLELFEGFDVQFWKRGPWAFPTASKISQFVEYVYGWIMGKEKDPERGHATIQLKGMECPQFVNGAPGINLDERSARNVLCRSVK